MSLIARFRSLGLLTAILGVGVLPAAAQQRDQVVYWPLVTDGREYIRVTYPQQAGPLLVLADTEVAIEVRRAPVSYWPITREYLADIARSTGIGGAELEILQGSEPARTLPREPYVVWHPEGIGAGPAELVRGDAAVVLYEEYVQKARASAEEVQRYQKLVAHHHAALEGWLRLAGERRGENMPDPPPPLNLTPPVPFRAYATVPAEGFVASLPAGNYALRLRSSDGRIVPGSERELVSFAALDRAFGYVIRREDRWTQPLASFAPNDIIYTTGAADLFLEPVPVAEYQAARITRLFRPQSVEVSDLSTKVWVPLPEGNVEQFASELLLWNGDRRLASLPRSGFRVTQVAGASRGYTIEHFKARPDASLEPDFSAMRVEADARVTRVSLAGGDGVVLRGSERHIRTVAPPAGPLLFLPAMLPLAIGAAVRVGSARRKRRRERAPEL